MVFFTIVGDNMRKKVNKLTIGGSLGIIAMFLMSIAWPATQLIAKIGALAIFAFICFAQLAQEKRKGVDVDKNIIFTIAVLLLLAYIFFF